MREGVQECVREVVREWVREVVREGVREVLREGKRCKSRDFQEKYATTLDVPNYEGLRYLS